jgi:hypothetical protein
VDPKAILDWKPLLFVDNKEKRFTWFRTIRYIHSGKFVTRIEKKKKKVFNMFV